MRTASVLLALMLALAAGCGRSTAPVDGVIIDLTHAFDEATVYWPTEDGFHLENRFRGVTEQGYYYEANRFSAPEHGGTHIDAPIHFYASRHSVDEIPVERLIGRGVLVDVTAACAANRDYRVTVQDLEAYERNHGRLPDGAIVLLRTGFGKYWPDRVRYMGTDARGPEAVAELHFPGLHADAASWLANERSIHVVGLDTPSIDHGPSTTFDSHVRLFEHNIAVLENVANLDRLPPKGFTVIALPIKIRGGSGGPARIIAILD